MDHPLFNPDGNEYKPIICVTKDTLSNVGDGAKGRPPCPDMMLVGIGHQMDRAYFTKIVHPGNSAKPLWNGYINLAKPSSVIGSLSGGGVLEGAGAFVRKHWMDGDGDEPFDPFASAGSKRASGDASAAPPAGDDAAAKGKKAKQK